MTPIQQVSYIVGKNLLGNTNKSKFISPVYIQRRSLSTKFSVVSLYESLKNRFSYIYVWYEEFNGFKEIKMAQDKVIAAGEKLEILQEERRKAWADLTEVQKKLKDNYNQLENTKKGDERYIDLIKLECILLGEEKTLEEHYRNIDGAERAQFSRYTSAVKNTHEIEKIQSEKKKYFSLLASIVGALIGIIGTTVNHYFKMSEIKLVLSELSDGYISEQFENQSKKIKNLSLAISDFEKNYNEGNLNRLYNKLNERLILMENFFKTIEGKDYGVIFGSEEPKNVMLESDYSSKFLRSDYMKYISVCSAGVICVVGLIILGAMTPEWRRERENVGDPSRGISHFLKTPVTRRLENTGSSLFIRQPEVSHKYTVTVAFQHPLIEKFREKDKFPYLRKNLALTSTDDSWQGEALHDLIMKPQIQPGTEYNRESRDSLQQYQQQTVPRAFTSVVNISVLNDIIKDDVYINSINDIDMDNLSRNKDGNVTILENNKLDDDKGNDGSVLVTWNTATVAEDWWSICQLPVFVVLFAVIGVLAISFIILLWLKNQMIQSDKQKKLGGLDSNDQLQLMSGSCPCPSPGLASEEQWICHTVINLKSSDDNSTGGAVQVQPQENSKLPDVLSRTVKDTEKRPEAVKIKTKGLLERRGSSASLTIDLSQNVYDKPQMVTPTRECTSEEFLLSAGNVLSRSQLKNCLKNVQSLHNEFWEIPLNHPEKSAVTGCGTKNRYESILPNERTRVKLAPGEENTLDSYINANYIRGYDGEERAYIATQGPLPNTVQDLYQMAWNDKSPIIVMITKLYEKAKIKCESYFPMEVNECITYGDFEVSVMSVQHKQGYTVRELLVHKNSETRLILHYWYDTWPDHKTPQNAHSIVAMATEIENCRSNFKNSSCPNNNEKYAVCDGPVIVHCSAGIGRTGCFIAISLAICQLMEENKVDILGIVCQMRYDRGGMIQTAEQYEFVHRAIALYAHSLPELDGD